MKLLFLCGSFEPGQDGVGDYTRMLATELIHQGHQVSVIALNDQHISETVDSIQEINGNSLPVLRIPHNLSGKKRFSRAKQCIEKFDPQWISLQYVPFSFHPKGLSLGLNRHLKILGKKRNWHIMFHELWVGMEKTAPQKLVWWGKLQQWIIQSLILNLKPGMIHTQSRFYQLQLQKLGSAVKTLPLFSNIPALKCAGLSRDNSLEPIEKNTSLTLVFFGAIHPGAPAKEFAKEAADYERKNHMHLVFKMLGYFSLEQERWTKILKSEGLKVMVLGPQPVECVSEILGTASIGISTTPTAIWEKSGAIAAMKEHGLPVLCVAKPWHPRVITNFEISPGITEYRKGNLEKFLTEKNNKTSLFTLADVSQQFVGDLG